MAFTYSKLFYVVNFFPKPKIHFVTNSIRITRSNKKILVLKDIYRTRAITNRGLNLGKTFLVLECGYYSREVTIQEKLFCTGYFLQLYFTKVVIKIF